MRAGTRAQRSRRSSTTRLRNSTGGTQPSAMTARACGWDMRYVWAFLRERAGKGTGRLYDASADMNKMSDRIPFAVRICLCRSIAFTAFQRAEDDAASRWRAVSRVSKRCRHQGAEHRRHFAYTHNFLKCVMSRLKASSHPWCCDCWPWAPTFVKPESQSGVDLGPIRTSPSVRGAHLREPL